MMNSPSFPSTQVLWDEPNKLFSTPRHCLSPLLHLLKWSLLQTSIPWATPWGGAAAFWSLCYKFWGQQEAHVLTALEKGFHLNIICLLLFAEAPYGCQRYIQDPPSTEPHLELEGTLKKGQFWNKSLEHRKCHRESCRRVAYVYPWSCTEDICNHNPTSGCVYFRRMTDVKCV